MSGGPTVIQGQIFLELEYHPTLDPVLIDPASVVAVLPSDSKEYSYISMSNGTKVPVMGEVVETGQLICKSRELVNQLTLGSMVNLIKEQIAGRPEHIN